PSPAHTAALSLAWRLPGCPSSPSVALQALPVAAPPPSSSAARQLTPMAAAPVASQAQAVLRGRLCDPAFVHSRLRSSPDTNYSKLKYLVSSSVSEACNNSVLLLGPRGCGKGAVLDMVLEDLKEEHPDAISVIRLNGMLHSDDNCATKEIARQLCLEHQLSFSKMASSDDNTEFMIDMLRECGLAHKTVIFVLEEFDLFAQGKQRLLYSLLDAMQSLTSQAVVIGLSCRLV
uniref:Origin of replication complex subunit 4 n=1 Tax=Aegilops tauschii subsp. strangulata TaxID=200361 RepID=A0A453FCP6_AEGTS